MSAADQSGPNRGSLIGRIAAWEADHPDGECHSYYRCWVQALERVLAERQLVSEDVVPSPG